MSAPHRPPDVIWDVTYACPLRCAHCYSESGRRASRQLNLEGMLRVADALISLGIPSIQFSGGEPLLVKGLFQVAERFVQAGIPVSLYTSGWLLEPALLPELLRSGDPHQPGWGDGAGPRHPARPAGLLRAGIASPRPAGRGRAAGAGASRQVPLLRDGLRRGAQQLPPAGGALHGGGAPVPGAEVPLPGRGHSLGAGSREGFAEHELLEEAQLKQLGSPGFSEYLKSLVPAPVQVCAFDGIDLQMHPEKLASGGGMSHLMQVEPDGQVRGIHIYEGTVGSLLEEPAQVLWERAFARPQDPFVVETLSPVRTMKTGPRRGAASRPLALGEGPKRIHRRPEIPRARRPSPACQPSPGWAEEELASRLT